MTAREHIHPSIDSSLGSTLVSFSCFFSKDKQVLMFQNLLSKYVELRFDGSTYQFHDGGSLPSGFISFYMSLSSDGNTMIYSSFSSYAVYRRTSRSAAWNSPLTISTDSNLGGRAKTVLNTDGSAIYFDKYVASTTAGQFGFIKYEFQSNAYA